MTLTTTQQVRLRIQDQPIIDDRVLYGNGTANLYALPYTNITSGTAYVAVGATGWSATGATFNPMGWVEFSATIPLDTPFRVRYEHSTFSDDEITDFVDAGGSIIGAAKEAVVTLMFDGLKRARWSSPDGTSYDDTAAIGLLRDLYDRLERAEEDAGVVGGGTISWASNQGDY